MIKVVVSEQKLYHRRKTGVVCAYPISTAAKGAGNEEGSYQTPLGKHAIKYKIGEGELPLTAFVARQAEGIFSPEDKQLRSDWILSRILWLEGKQTGINKRGKVDTFKRYIYIHGTDEEDKIGKPVSHGCIRMNNDDMIDLFEHVSNGETVVIKP
jgi:lipoprotein-anchoring transpeptidase ErfK/SrfK